MQGSLKQKVATYLSIKVALVFIANNNLRSFFQATTKKPLHLGISASLASIFVHTSVVTWGTLPFAGNGYPFSRRLGA